MTMEAFNSLSYLLELQIGKIQIEMKKEDYGEGPLKDSKELYQIELDKLWHAREELDKAYATNKTW